MKLTRVATGAFAVVASMVLVTAGCSSPAKPTAGGAPGAAGAGSTASSAADPHGGHATYSPPPAQPLRAGEHFTSVYMPKPYTAKAPNGGTDEYRCFLVDPGISRNEYLTGSQFLPQNAAIVHHAIFFRISPDQAASARRLDEDSPGQGWTCFGDSGVEGAPWVASWAPGWHEVLLGANFGYAMPPGSMLVMQVHYNLLATGGKAPSPDQSGIRLRLSTKTAGMLPLSTTLLPAPVELPCAAGESGPLCDRAAAIADVSHRFGPEARSMVAGLNRFCNAGRSPGAGITQHCDHESPGPAVIRAVAGHMHLLGRSIKIELNPGTAKAKTLLDVPSYNFDDQSIRLLPTPVRIDAGDVLRVTCTHDAGLRKQLPQLRTTPARYVVWGDGTTDEMCLGIVVWTFS